MTDEIDFEIRPVKDDAELEQAFAIRREVFVDEQGVPEEMEFDAHDRKADMLHLLAFDRHQAMGTARLHFLDEGWAKFERIAVREAGRGKGLGEALVAALLQYARARGCSRFKLNAQCVAEGFYARFGFAAHGEVFDDAGIPHREMRRQD